MSSKGSDSKNLVGLVYQRVTLSIRPSRLIHVKHEEFGCISVLKRVISDSLKWYLGEWPDIIDIGLFKKKTKWKSWSGVVSKMFSVSENVFNTDVSMARWHTLRLAVPDTPHSHSTVRVHQNLHHPKPPAWRIATLPARDVQHLTRMSVFSSRLPRLDPWHSLSATEKF